MIATAPTLPIVDLAGLRVRLEAERRALVAKLAARVNDGGWPVLDGGVMSELACVQAALAAVGAVADEAGGKA